MTASCLALVLGVGDVTQASKPGTHNETSRHHHLPPRPRVSQTRFTAIETLDAVFHLPGLEGSARSKIAVRLEGQQEEPNM